MNDTAWFEAGHVAIVTGGSRGLGKALARQLLERGVTVIVDGRDPVALERVRVELGELGTLVTIRGDVSSKDHIHALIGAARAWGRLDLLVNNASTLGETPLPRIDQLSEGTFTRLFAVNVFAPIHLIQHALPLMRRSSEMATIVNVTSDAGAQAYRTWGGYGSSKAALEHVSRVLAAEIDDTRVRVLVADPGDMDTEMHAAAVPGADTSQLARPDDVAAALLRTIAQMREPYERVELATLGAAV